MTRGGVRKGAGRPKSKGEKRTANLCGVRLTPSTLARFKRVAAAMDLSFTDWVEFKLIQAADDGERTVQYYERVIAVAEKRKRRCGIPAKTLGPCDLEWGHEGDIHANASDGFYARDYEQKHRKRQERRHEKAK